MSTRHFDGNYDLPAMHGTPRRVIDYENRATLWEVTYHQKATKHKYDKHLLSKPPLNVGIPAGRGVVLVEESSTSDIGAGICEWVRTFAEHPEEWHEPVKLVHAYQFTADDAGQLALLEIPKPVTGIMVHEYFLTPDPTRISLPSARVMIQVGPVTKYVGDPRSSTDRVFRTSGSSLVALLGRRYLLAQDAQLSRWRGNFYRRDLLYVPDIDAPRELTNEVVGISF